MNHIDKALLSTYLGQALLDRFPQGAENKLWGLVERVQDRFGPLDDITLKICKSRGRYTSDGFTGITNFRVTFNFTSGWIMTYFWNWDRWQVSTNFKRLLKLKRNQKFMGHVPYAPSYKGRQYQPMD
jgi:hypothetical protein